MGNKIVELLASLTTSTKEIKDYILVLQFTVVNTCLIADPKSNEQPILVDTGLENSADFIIHTFKKTFW